MTTKTKKAAPAAAKGQEPAISTNGDKPAPIPGDKGYDWKQDYPGERVFRYTTPKDQKTTQGDSCGGKVVGLAAISEKRQPSVGFLRAVRRKPEFDQVLDMIEIVACDKALALIDEWRPTDLQALFEQWSEWSNTSAGES